MTSAKMQPKTGRKCLTLSLMPKVFARQHWLHQKSNQSLQVETVSAMPSYSVLVFSSCLFCLQLSAYSCTTEHTNNNHRNRYCNDVFEFRVQFSLVELVRPQRTNFNFQSSGGPSRTSTPSIKGNHSRLLLSPLRFLL